MKQLQESLQTFFDQHDPVIVVNTSTNRALLCLRPVMSIQPDGKSLFLQFDSLNDRGGNSLLVKAIHGKEPATLYVENEEENILMLQELNLVNYRHYILPHYVNAPKFEDEASLKKYVLAQ